MTPRRAIGLMPPGGAGATVLTALWAALMLSPAACT
jgi:hypothetical protein